MKDLVDQIANKMDNFDAMYRGGTAESSGLEIMMDTTSLP